MTILEKVRQDMKDNPERLREKVVEYGEFSTMEKIIRSKKTIGISHRIMPIPKSGK